MLENDKFKCQNCLFEGKRKEWKSLPRPSFQMSLLDSFFSRGKVERDYICPKCNKTTPIPDRKFTKQEKWVIYLFALAMIIMVLACVSLGRNSH